MRITIVLAVCALVFSTASVLAQPGVFFLPPQQRVAYSIAPPASVSVVLPSVTLHLPMNCEPWKLVRPKPDCWVQWNTWLPQQGTSWIGKLLYCSCSVTLYTQDEPWRLKPSTYWPYAKQYLLRAPNESHSWQKFALCIDVPRLDRGTRPDYAVSVINSKVFEDYVVGNGILIPSSQKFPIVPAPTVEMVGGSSNIPTQMKLTFHQVSIEWFRYTWKARLRSGNVVLIDELGWHWDTQNLNLIHLWHFQVDLAAKTVGFYDWKAAMAGVPSKVHPTTLSVSIDDSSGDSMRLFPGLWW